MGHPDVPAPGLDDTPGTLLPAQTIADRTLTAEAGLAAAVLERALDDVAGRNLHGAASSRAAELREDAERWISGGSRSPSRETASSRPRSIELEA